MTYGRSFNFIVMNFTTMKNFPDYIISIKKKETGTLPITISSRVNESRDTISLRGCKMAAYAYVAFPIADLHVRISIYLVTFIKQIATT